MLVHILDDLVRIQRQNNPQIQPGLLPQRIIPLAKYGMLWYGMVWYGMVCGVWCGLLKKDLALLSPTRNHPRDWTHSDLVDEHLLDTKRSQVLHSPFHVHMPTYYK